MPSINIRVSKAEKAKLMAVAASEGKTLSAMLREAAVLEAQKVLRRFPKTAVKR